MPEERPHDALDDAQEDLGKALDRARAGEDRELAAIVRDEGHQVVRLVFGLIRLTRVHEIDNNVFNKPLAELERVIDKLLNVLGVVHLIAVEDQVYINDIRIRFMDRGEGAQELGSELRRLDVGGISFHDIATVEQLRVLTNAFALPPVGVTSRRELVERLKGVGATGIEVHGMFKFRMSGEEAQAQDIDVGVVAKRATRVVDETWDNMVGQRVPNPLPLRRAVTEILSSGSGAEGLWDEPVGSSPFGRHTLRVTRLALLLARQAGLSDEAVQDLGLAAMFHDIGYAGREGARPATANDPGEPGYAPPYERHAPAGTRLLLKQRGFHEAKVRRALAILEHHRDFKPAEGGRRPWLFARIIRICEDFDNLVRRRGARMTPLAALRAIQAGAGTRYDPVLAQAFINVVGAFPPGTQLQLEDGRVVRSISLVRKPETWSKPECRLERLADGQPAPADAPLVDLAVEGKVVKVLNER